MGIILPAAGIGASHLVLHARPFPSSALPWNADIDMLCRSPARSQEVQVLIPPCSSRLHAACEHLKTSSTQIDIIQGLTTRASHDRTVMPKPVARLVARSWRAFATRSDLVHYGNRSRANRKLAVKLEQLRLHYVNLHAFPLHKLIHLVKFILSIPADIFRIRLVTFCTMPLT